MAFKDYGKNIKAEIKGGILTTKSDLSIELGPSKSKKTIMVATSQGNMRIQDDDGAVWILGYNLYKYPPEK